MGTLGKRLLRAAKEGRAIARGEADRATYKVFVPTTIDCEGYPPPNRPDARRIQLTILTLAAKLAGLGARSAYARSDDPRLSDRNRSRSRSG